MNSYNEIGIVKTDRLRQHRNDGDHIVLEAGLKGSALLHRFQNKAGVPYSAIYDSNMNEIMSTERAREHIMIKNYQMWYEKLYA